MKIHLQYGTDGIEINLPEVNTTIFNPKFLAGLPDEAASFREAVRNPINAKPLRELIKSSDKVAVVIPDLTRPLPTEKLLTWTFEELAHVPTENFTIINGTGSHRANTPAATTESPRSGKATIPIGAAGIATISSPMRIALGIRTSTSIRTRTSIRRRSAPSSSGGDFDSQAA